MGRDMEYLNHNGGIMRKLAGTLKRGAAVFSLVLILQFSAPIPGHANIVSDPLAEASAASTAASLLAQLANFILEQAQWLQQNYADAVHTATNTISQLLNTKAHMVTAQGIVDGQTQAQLAKGAGDLAAKAMLAETSEACALMRERQASTAAENAAQAATENLAKYASMAGVGVGGDAGSPSFDMVEVYDLCRLGFIDNDSRTGRYADLGTNMSCNFVAPRFINADMSVSSVLDRLQFPLPKKEHVFKTSDGHFVFSNPANPNDTTNIASATETAPGLGSEMDYVAAYKFCEHLRTPSSAPNGSGTVTARAIQGVAADRRVTAQQLAAADQCMRSLSRRMACPAGSSSALQDTGGSSCHDAQVKVCKRLKGTRAYGGLNMTGSANPLYAAALANCETEGLSQAMAAAIKAHKCEEENYVLNIPVKNGGNADAMEQSADYECSRMVADYDRDQQTERLLFEISMQNLAASRGGGGVQSTPVVR